MVRESSENFSDSNPSESCESVEIDMGEEVRQISSISPNSSLSSNSYKNSMSSPQSVPSPQFPNFCQNDLINSNPNKNQGKNIPCIILSPSSSSRLNFGQNFEPQINFPILSPLDSIMTKISKLSSSPFLKIGPSSGERYHENKLRESVELIGSMRQLVKKSENIDKIEDSTKRSENYKEFEKSERQFQNKNMEESKESNIYDIGEEESETGKKLSFGMDRILSYKDKKKQDEGEMSKDESMTKPHSHFHSSSTSGVISHCSECYLLSQLYYKFPPTNIPHSSTLICPPSPNYSHQWANNQYINNPQAHRAGFGPHSQTSSFVHSSPFSSLSSIVSCSTNGGSGRRKRSWSRAVFSNLQRKGLEKRFQIQKYITKPDRRQLAATLGLTDAQVKVWFQNRRMKWRHTKEGKSGHSDKMIPSHK